MPDSQKPFCGEEGGRRLAIYGPVWEGRGGLTIARRTSTSGGLPIGTAPGGAWAVDGPGAAVDGPGTAVDGPGTAVDSASPSSVSSCDSKARQFSIY